MATRFWVGGTGTWDSSTTTHWAATTGGAGGQTVPGSSDTVTFDGSSGGGTVTVNTTVNSTSITMGAFTGTLDFSANNNNVTLGTFSNSGSATRTLNMGNGTWTITSSGPGNIFDHGTVTGLTFNANSSTLLFSVGGTGAASNNTRTFVMGTALAYNIVSVASDSGGNSFTFNVGSNSTTIATMLLAAPLALIIQTSHLTVTNPVSWAGSSLSSMLSFVSNASFSFALAAGSTLSWCVFRSVSFASGSAQTATNSIDLYGNTNITITPPSTGGTAGIIGS